VVEVAVRRLVILVVLLALMIAGGGLTALFLTTGTSMFPVLTITQDPSASSLIMQPWKAEQLFLFVGFVIFNLVGIALTLAIVLWLLDRSMQNTRLKQAGIVPNAGTTVEVRNVESLPAKTAAAPAKK